MKRSTLEESEYGCVIACFAVACNLGFEEAAKSLEDEQAQSNQFNIKDSRTELNRFGIYLVIKDGERLLIKNNQARYCLQDGPLHNHMKILPT